MHQYYNPDLTPEQMNELDRRNLVMLTAVQASIGNLHPAIRAVFVELHGSEVYLHFIVSQGVDSECEEDIDDTASEFNAMTWNIADVTAVAVLHVDEAPRNWVELGWHPIFWAKGWSAWTD
ncbi:hypothetical protein [Demequina sp.]|uniref:hypothetical protein n=1 Tax=Demequina sp. TaxID=2050685 RepID=UPI003D1398F2